MYLHTDASDYGAGAYLFQIDPDTGKELPIQFLSKTFSDVQKRWSTIEKECYSIFYALRELEHLIRDRKFTLRTDHRNLLFLNAQATSKVTRWKLAIQEYDFDIEHIPGRDNIVADQMSRLCADNKSENVFTSEAVALCLATVMSPMPYVRCAAGTMANRSAGIPSRDETRLPNAAFRILRQVHCGAVGHHGVDRTTAAVREYLARTGKTCWSDDKSLRADVEQFVRECHVCQKLSQVRPAVLTEPFTISSERPMEQISIDTMGPSGKYLPGSYC